MSSFNDPGKKQILGRAITEEVDSEDVGEGILSDMSSPSSKSCQSEDQLVAPSDFQQAVNKKILKKAETFEPMQLQGAKVLVPRKTAPSIQKDLLRLAKTKSLEPAKRRLSEYVKLDGSNMAALLPGAETKL